MRSLPSLRLRRRAVKREAPPALAPDTVSLSGPRGERRPRPEPPPSPTEPASARPPVAQRAASLARRSLQRLRAVRLPLPPRRVWPEDSGGRSLPLAGALAAGGLLVLATWAGTVEPAAPEPPELAGVCFEHSWGGRGYGSSAAGESLSAAAELGVSWVSLSPTGYMDAEDDDSVRLAHRLRGGETDEAVAAEIRRAHAFGLSVLLAPRIWVLGGGQRSRIDPGSEAGWSRWMDSYLGFVLHYARLAAREGVEGLVVGTDLGSSVATQPGRWQELLAEVRKVYEGRITYAAAWDAVERVPFWKRVDWVGVLAYEPLASSARPGVRELSEGARLLARRLEQVATDAGRPVVLTEVGYRPVVGAASTFRFGPDRSVTLDTTQQARAFRSLLGTLAGRRWFAGLFVWSWPTDLHAAEADLGGFLPRRATRRVLRDFFGGPRGLPELPGTSCGDGPVLC